jgi:putative FmdB family regulatory protein
VPLYEYVCEEDGSVIELLRAMSDADKPVEDPHGKGRTFKRTHSRFATSGASSGAAAGGSASLLAKNTCCPCGKVGGCGSN